MSPTPTNPTGIGPINPITCPEPGCHWACHGVPDKYADSRAGILAEHHAAEHTPTPAPAPVAVWSDGDPLMEAIAAAVYDQCETHPEQALIVDDPRNIAAVAATVARRVLGTPTTNTETPAPAVDLPAVLREAADDLTALAAPDSERGTGVRWAADHLRHKADQVDTGGDDEVDDTLHACPDRWAGPNCRCFDADTVEQPDEQPLTAAQREYVTAQYDLFQLAAHGHYTYAPLHDRKTGAYLSTQQIKAGQQDYNDRLRAAQARSEAATIRAAADWLRTEYPGPDLDAHIRRAADALDRYAALPAP